MTRMTGAHGFTIIELLVAVFIVAILAAVAFPSYQRYVVRGQRSQAAQLMAHIASREEQYMLDARSYTATIGAGGLNVTADGWTCAANCTNGRYTVSVTPQAGPPPSYSISAQALGSQSSDGDLVLGSDGSRSRSAGDGKW
jgi:type IV pilus assembly protein PilE